MGAAMFYPRTSVLPTIKTSLPSSINCLTNHPVDDGHQSRFHEHNHCWLRIVCRRKEIYLFDEKPPIDSCSGAAGLEVGWEQYIRAASPQTFYIFTIFCSNMTAAGWRRDRKAGVGGFEKFCFVRDVGTCPKLRTNASPVPGWQPLITIITSPIYCGRQTNVRP